MGKVVKCARPKETLKKERAPFYKTMQNISALPSVYFMDLLDVMCTQDHCNELVPGTRRTLAIEDTGHLTNAGSLFLAPFICQFLRGTVSTSGFEQNRPEETAHVES